MLKLVNVKNNINHSKKCKCVSSAITIFEVCIQTPKMRLLLRVRLLVLLFCLPTLQHKRRSGRNPREGSSVKHCSGPNRHTKSPAQRPHAVWVFKSGILKPQRVRRQSRIISQMSCLPLRGLHFNLIKCLMHLTTLLFKGSETTAEHQDENTADLIKRSGVIMKRTCCKGENELIIHNFLSQSYKLFAPTAEV